MISTVVFFVVTIICWVVGSRKDKTAADRLLMESEFKEDAAFTKQIDHLLRRELKQQRRKAVS